MSDAEKVVGILDAVGREQQQSVPEIEGEHRIVGVVTGSLIGFAEDGSPHVSWPGCSAAKAPRARALCDLEREDIGHQVALIFEQGDAAKPMIIGRVRAPRKAGSQSRNRPAPEAPPFELEVDGKRVALNAERELVLRCGEASITLTAAGKVLIKGAYVSSRSSGVNRLRGGVVHIN